MKPLPKMGYGESATWEVEGAYQVEDEKERLNEAISLIWKWKLVIGLICMSAGAGLALAERRRKEENIKRIWRGMIRARRSKKIREKSKSIRWQKREGRDFMDQMAKGLLFGAAVLSQAAAGMFPRCRGIHRSGQDSAGSRRAG